MDELKCPKCGNVVIQNALDKFACSEKCFLCFTGQELAVEWQSRALKAESTLEAAKKEIWNKMRCMYGYDTGKCERIKGEFCFYEACPLLKTDKGGEQNGL